MSNPARHFTAEPTAAAAGLVDAALEDTRGAGERRQALKSVIAVAAGQLAHEIGDAGCAQVLRNIAAKLLGGGQA